MKMFLYNVLISNFVKKKQQNKNNKKLLIISIICIPLYDKYFLPNVDINKIIQKFTIINKRLKFVDVI